MKKINLYITFFLLSTSVQGINEPIILSTIFAPAPLLEFHQENRWQSNSISFLKKAIIPLTCGFCYGIKKNDIWTDIVNNPYSTVILACATAHYYTYQTMQNQQNEIDEEIIDMMQHIFHLLIIGHGIYNKIIKPTEHHNKISVVINVSALTTLQLFLHKAYNTWFILFSYYEEHYKNKPLYAYQMDKIELFEVLQASTHEPDILPLITNFYDKNNVFYDYEPILDCLEIKLKLINHKMFKKKFISDHEK